MEEQQAVTNLHLDRGIEQAIVTLKKGAHLLKYGRRGKPKLCPFRLSSDEKVLLWYSGKEEKQLKLSSVTKIIPGQRTVNFQRQPQLEKECESFSIVYGNGEISLDLICKDKDQAETWFIGLKALMSRSHRSKYLANLRNGRGAHSCVNSPVGHARRKHSSGLFEDSAKFSQVHSLCGSPQSLSERCFSDGSVYSSDSFYSFERKMSSHLQKVTDNTPRYSPRELEYFKENMRDAYLRNGFGACSPSAVSSSTSSHPLIDKDELLRDILMWGEGVETRVFGDTVDGLNSPFQTRSDVLLPKLVQSTSMLDVKSISCGGKHVALVTKQGGVFCWGEEKGGRLGHRIKMDVPYPKIVESLTDVLVESVACGEYHTCALTRFGELYTWGEAGQNVGQLSDESNRSWWLPRLVAGPLEGLCIINVACGEWHTALVTSNGQLFTYGDGTFGVLGHGDLQSCSQPKAVESLKGSWVKSVACGTWHTASIVETISGRFKGDSHSGKLFTWGDGDKGRLGHKDKERKLVPTCVAPLMDHDFVQVSCGRMLTVALDVTGIVYTMGSAIHGQLGGSQYEDNTYAVVEGKLRGEFVKEISSGQYHVAVLTSMGKVYTWGMGSNGRLGLGDVEDRSSPSLVEALKDRQVQNVACGSGFTAAICLHKSISSMDQSICSGCKMAFGFNRKKHNCYNCGFSFCHACSSKKVSNASLGLNKNKQYRVCDPCFNHLTKIVDSKLWQEKESPRPPLGTRKPFPDLKVEREESRFMLSQIFSPKISPCEEIKCLGGEKLTQALSNKTPRWGHVECPVPFKTNNRGNSRVFSLPADDELCMTPSSAVLEEGSIEADKKLTEEVQMLQTEAKRLGKVCEMRQEKILQYKEKIEESWLLAKEEADKCKAAKEVIKVLTTQLNAISDKFPGGKEARNVRHLKMSSKADVELPRTPVHGESLDFDDVKSTYGREENHFSDDIKILKERPVNDVRMPFHIPCDILMGTQIRDKNHGQMKPVDNSLKTRSDDSRKVTDALKTEWVEQDQPGVYITFVTLPCGQKGLKRVRFSRKRFSETEAEKWWEENQIRVYQKYDIEGIINTSSVKLNGR